ncbi:hypothetical protein C8R44DRAFT_809830 [Mycena epipterygia]|nr:hypothetical protein C8R44DRAFT_809830 [Mycena epipterygia]
MTAVRICCFVRFLLSFSTRANTDTPYVHPGSGQGNDVKHAIPIPGHLCKLSAFMYSYKRGAVLDCALRLRRRAPHQRLGCRPRSEVPNSRRLQLRNRRRSKLRTRSSPL